MQYLAVFGGFGFNFFGRLDLVAVKGWTGELSFSHYFEARCFVLSISFGSVDGKIYLFGTAVLSIFFLGMVCFVSDPMIFGSVCVLGVSEEGCFLFFDGEAIEFVQIIHFFL